MTDNDPISWRAVVYGTPVMANDGTQVGTVSEVLGSDSEDIFHGIRVTLSGHPDLMLPSSDVSILTRSAITADLTPAEFAVLAPYDEQASFHLASVGWLRKHVGWTQDSKSDEEPG